jgi:DNA gyrase subunit A
VSDTPPDDPARSSDEQARLRARAARRGDAAVLIADYAMSVIVSRALPDARDGLKPVHRRILYGMREGGYTPEKPYRKSAKMVGEVMGNFHPHGDARDLRRAGAHGAGLLACACRWSTARAISARSTAIRRRPCATPRRRLAKVGACAAGGHRQGHRRLPARTTTIPSTSRRSCRRAIPNLLVNGAGGIAVGMATNIPPHNLGEVIDACAGPDRQSRLSPRRPDGDRPGPGLPDRRR